MNNNIKKSIKRLKEINTEYADLYNHSREKAYKEYINDLDPYATIPKNDFFYNGAAKDAFKVDAKKLADEARGIIDDISTEINGVKDTAPTADIVNRLSMLKMRKNVTADDIDSALRTCGDNYGAYQIIKEVADENKIGIGQHPADGIIDSLESCRKFVNSFGTDKEITRGAAAFINMTMGGDEE